MEQTKKSTRYFCLKLEENFFGDPKIKKLRMLPGGDTLTIIYLELMILSIGNNGILVYEGLEDTFEAELHLKIEEDKNAILIVLNFLRQYNLLIEIENASTFFLAKNNWSIGSETQWARYKRNAKIKKLENFQQLSNNFPIEKKKENNQKEKEKDQKEKENKQNKKENTTTTARACEELKYQYVEAEGGAAYLFISDAQIEALFSTYSQETLGYYLLKMNELSIQGYKHGCSDYEYIKKLINEDRRT